MRTSPATLRKLITDALDRNNNTWGDIESLEFRAPEDYANYPTNRYPFYSGNQENVIGKLSDDEKLNLIFDGGYGDACPIKILAWTNGYVYFSQEYDGADFIESVPRNPKGNKCQQ